MQISNKTWIALIAGLFLLAAAASAILFLNAKPGTQVLVTVNGREYGTYDLHTDQTVRIEGDSWHNTLVIRSGKASISEADCDNQLCVHMSPLQENTVGLIVCLPHGVVVELAEPESK